MKRYISLGIMALVIAATTGFGETFNCGHGCSITCPDGGGCVYNHNTGGCSTFCNEQGVMELKSTGTAEGKATSVAKDAKLTIRFENVTPKELKKALGQLGIL